MLTLDMKKGNYKGFNDPSSILISESLAKSLFGKEEPVNKILSVNHEFDLKISGVFQNLPFNTDFRDVQFLIAWNNKNNTGNTHNDDWLDHHFQTYVQLNDHISFAGISAKIKNLSKPHIPGGWEELKVHPMDSWHLYTNFSGEGRNGQGRIQFVWLFGIVGVFVLILACINFMNLATARSSKRAKEVGIRKTIGSLPIHLVAQFLIESVLLTMFAFVVAVLLAQLSMPFFNSISGKHIGLPYQNPIFWMLCLAFALFTGIISGSYPAFYLSSFEPIKVLK